MRVDSTFTEMLYLLGKLYQDLKKDLEEAKKFLSEAFEKYRAGLEKGCHMEVALVLVNLASVHLEMDDKEEAENRMEDALKELEGLQERGHENDAKKMAGELLTNVTGLW